MKNYSQFHDGFLEGLWIDCSTVHVYLSMANKQRFVITASDVAALTAGTFRKGNIIFEVLTRDHEEIDLSDIDGLYDVAAGPVGDSQHLKLLEKARQGELTLLEINPSYGASCLVLAYSIVLQERSDWLTLPKKNDR